ncbi:hypothetical protein R83H12_01950 [Fibrobacteria bacterium R8-3-H12]
MAATLGLAITFTFSCSSGDDGGEQGGSFNENSQIYAGYEDENDILHIGEAYKGSGNLYVTSSAGFDCSRDGSGCDWDHIRVGSVTNGIVNLNLPKSIPDEYLDDVLSDESQNFCTSYPKGIKGWNHSFFVLTDINENYISTLGVTYGDEQGQEVIMYLYFSKAGKIACEYGSHRKFIYSIDAKEGLNKIYVRQQIKDGIETIEYNTNNILTKEKDMKWIIYLED